MKKETPILYSTPMVKSIVKNTKTKTRRTRGLDKINLNPDDWIFNEIDPAGSFVFEHKNFDETFWVNSPYGNVGDLLWVRETFVDISSYKKAPLFSDLEGNFLYKADDEFIGCHKWKPSIHMPKVAARIWLEITHIKIERLQSITHEDAIAEGIEDRWDCAEREFRDYMSKNQESNDWGDTYFNQANLSFISLWESINGLGSSELNPWVWVIEFEKVEKP